MVLLYQRAFKVLFSPEQSLFYFSGSEKTRIYIIVNLKILFENVFTLSHFPHSLIRFVNHLRGINIFFIFLKINFNIIFFIIPTVNYIYIKQPLLYKK